MMGRNKGFNTKLKAIAPQCRIIHCFIHRQALAAKKLSEKLSDVLNVCIKVVNLLKSRPLNSRLFAELCADEDHQYLLIHTEVRWLLRDRVLGRVFELRDRILEFLKNIDSDILRFLLIFNLSAVWGISQTFLITITMSTSISKVKVSQSSIVCKL